MYLNTCAASSKKPVLPHKKCLEPFRPLEPLNGVFLPPPTKKSLNFKKLIALAMEELISDIQYNNVVWSSEETNL